MSYPKRKRRVSDYWEWDDPLNLFIFCGLYLLSYGHHVMDEMAMMVFGGVIFLYLFRFYDKKQSDGDAIKYVLTHIQHNHLESLKQKVKDHPDVLYEEYKKKDLCYWALYYKNQKAHDLIIRLRNEYFEDKP